jgi:hypothetical protein
MNLNKTINHPLEEVFGIEPGSSFNNPAVIDHDDYEMVPNSEVAQGHQDDEEDIDINNKIETIYDAALSAYEQQNGMAEIVEPRYAARNAEVAAQYLGLALNAVSLKARTKNDKRKSAQFIPFTNNNISNSNVVVADRNSIMQMIADKKKLKDESNS